MADQSAPFGKIRGFLFPIHVHELKKFIPLGGMMFFILFNYTLLRDTKDTLIVHTAGAEALSFIKLFGTVPAALLAMVLYAKLSNIFSRNALFYIALIPFLLFFGLFSWAIYPHLDSLHPSLTTIERFAAEYPRLKTVAFVLGNWSYALFYILSELWGSVVMSLLFWQMANDIVKIDQAKRFYTFFGMIANFGSVAAGLAVQHFAKVRQASGIGVDPWQTTLHSLMAAVLFCGACIFCLRWWIWRDVTETASPAEVKKKPKLSLKESFRYLIRSKHLGYIAVMVICYGISQNVVEAVWKGQIKEIYGNMNDYSAFMGRYSTVNGLLTIFFMLTGGWVIRRFGWLAGAVLTPLMILVTGSLFFSFILFKEQLAPHTLALFGMAPSLLIVWIGFAQNSLSKSTKYSLFDPTKEMCYIPLDLEAKTKGKAAVDVVGGRLGKSGGAALQQLLLVLTGQSLLSLSGYFAVIVLLATGLWLIATRRLDDSLQEIQTPTQPAAV